MNLPYTDLDQMQLTPSDFARQARFFFGLPKGPICDIIHLMESNGIILRPLDCTVEASFSALSTLTKEGVARVVFIDQNMPPSRKVFVLARELGHILMHFNSLVNGNTYLINQEADEFALSFLMPDEDIAHQLSQLSLAKLISLKEYWRVSIVALLYKAKSLRLSKVPYRKGMAQIKSEEFRYEEPGEFIINEPELLTQMLQMHLEKLEYSEQELLKLLTLNKEDFTKYYYTDKLSPWIQPERDPRFKVV